MEKGLTVKQQEALMIQEMNAFTQNNDAHITAEDIAIPHLRLIQGTSSTEGLDDDVNVGDMVLSSGTASLGNNKKPIKFTYVIDEMKNFIISKDIDGTFKWIDRQPFDAKLAQQWAFDEYNGEQGSYKREVCYHFYILIDGHTSPTKVSFKGASAKAGKQLYSILTDMKFLKMNYWDSYLSLKSKSVSKNGKKWQEFSVELMDTKANPTDMKTRLLAFEWAKTIKSGAFVDKSLEAVEVSTDEIPF